MTKEERRQIVEALLDMIGIEPGKEENDVDQIEIVDD